MSYIYKIVLSFLLILVVDSNVCAAQAKLSVNLPALSLTLNYPEPVRLSRVLSESQAWLDKRNKNATFWLAAQLIDENKNKQITQLKDNLLTTLTRLIKERPDTKLKAEVLSAFINQNSFNYRHFISLDNDLVRIQSDHDPLLKGKLQLLTPARVNRIRIVGSAAAEQSATLVEHATINDYIKNTPLPDNSDTAYVYIIQPDGALSKSRNAYWQRTPTFFAPGASLFIGFKSLPAQYSSLNQQIAELLRYITPLTQGSQI